MTATSGLTITWLGHAATRIEAADGKVILVDPWIHSSPVAPEQEKSIDRADLILVSHGHGDNMGEAIQIAQEHRSHVIAMNEMCGYMTSKGVQDCSGGNTGGSQEWQGLRVTMVEAVHSSSVEDSGQVIYTGLAVGFVVVFPDGFTVYHAGDTALFEGMRLIGRMHQPDVALLPIGDHYTMGPRDAGEAVRLLGVKAVIPIHYGTFPILTGTAERFQQEVSDIAGLKVFVLKPGDSVTQAQIVGTG